MSSLKVSMKLWLSNNVLTFKIFFFLWKSKDSEIDIWFSNFPVDQERILLQVPLFKNTKSETVILSYCF